MWKKLKKIFSIVGAFISVLFFTFILLWLRPSSFNRKRSTDDIERDRRIKDGLEGSQGRVDTIKRESSEGSRRISNAENGIRRCEEHLRRAEEILRGAINKSREDKQ